MLSSVGRTRAVGGAPAIALIGCGAIAERLHLPALTRHAEVARKLVLVDPELERARALAARYGAAGVAASHEEVVGEADGAIVAAPHRLHVPIASDCLRAGVDVLCEKPLAETPEEVDELVGLAERHGAHLAVNNTRRLYPASRKVRELILSGAIGTPRRLVYVQGEEFDWPSASPFTFGLAGDGKGVLRDVGAHVLDLVCWWLGEKPRVVRYRDDAHGGSEALADLVFETGDVDGHVRLSWLTKLENTFRVEGDDGAVAGDVFGFRSVVHTEGAGRSRRLRLPSRAGVLSDFGEILVDNFLQVVTGDARPLVAGHEVRDSIALIEDCYRQRERLELPWLRPRVGVSGAVPG